MMSETSNSSRSTTHDGTIVVIGGGEIGLCMATVLADAGWEIDLIEPSDEAREKIGDRLPEQIPDMQTAGLLKSDPDDLLGRVTCHARLEDARTSPRLIVEAGPENLGIKQSIFAEARAWVGSDIPIATTSSAMMISEIVSRPEDRTHCLVAHCANPPTIIRIMECVPAPETSLHTLAFVSDLLDDAGFLTVRLGKEIPGFALNRLQSALLREAYRLVEAEIVDVAGVDRLVAHGLGPRWALSGPFETAELNTPGGIKAHAERMGPAYKKIGEEIGERNAGWSDELVEKVSSQRREIIALDDLPKRINWRRKALAQLIGYRRALLDAWND